LKEVNIVAPTMTFLSAEEEQEQPDEAP